MFYVGLLCPRHPGPKSLKDLEKYKAMGLVMKILVVYEQRQTCKNMFTLQYGRC